MVYTVQSPSFDTLNRLACCSASREAVVRIICNCALVFILLLRFLLSPVHPIPEPWYHYPGTASTRWRWEASRSEVSRPGTSVCVVTPCRGAWVSRLERF